MVSVMIPVFNGRETLPIALRSLQHQTYDNWEAVVVDDGSTDGTGELLDSLTDPRIRVIRHAENLGRALARQTALNEVQAEFVAYLDSDDFYHPLKIEKQVKFMLLNPSLSYCGCAVGSFDGSFGLRRIRGSVHLRNKKYRFGERFPTVPAASMIRADLARRVSYTPHLTLGEDTDYLRRAIDGEEIGAIPDVLYFYSEYASVSLPKIMKSYVATARYALSKLPENRWFYSRLFVSRVARLIFTLTMAPFLDAETLLDRRGREPTFSEIDDFEAAKEILGISV